MANVWVSVQYVSASVTVMLQLPMPSPVAVGVVSVAEGPVHKYVWVPDPAVKLRMLAVPLDIPKQDTWGEALRLPVSGITGKNVTVCVKVKFVGWSFTVTV